MSAGHTGGSIMSEPGPGRREAVLTEEMVFATGVLCEAEGREVSRPASTALVGILASLAAGYTVCVGTDALSFARHGKRKNVTEKDVLLCARRLPKVRQRVADALDALPSRPSKRRKTSKSVSKPSKAASKAASASCPPDQPRSVCFDIDADLLPRPAAPSAPAPASAAALSAPATAAARRSAIGDISISISISSSDSDDDAAVRGVSARARPQPRPRSPGEVIVLDSPSRPAAPAAPAASIPASPPSNGITGLDDDFDWSAVVSALDI
ncbi:uncharacterized protein AMSG_02331 [Thecamonas trahens ATCC 50062]|uniref:Uncharacterized protein n=1 Tax=Thecamonas trahens ATCC 50062 TaxID=461836 RepID=A0A0L0DWA0_THETB|nr:hypothetical protein AMSG_02331 [Thecamonas trahens ATCC 50062]KNC56361.1 hypothetical protein AMSG_02331 [Thecamonas trahens ATCC 50062]|eukprot:XP_013760876.1 hypothetical protein AMSG_02331 [Thecamonas trahens ATCC 50062]